MFTPRTVALAALAGVAGCIANSIAITALAGAPLMPLIFSLGREFFSILFAMALIPIFARMSGAAAWAAGFVALEALASLSAKLIWGVGAPWSFVLMVNGIYALTAVAVYAAARNRGPSRGIGPASENGDSE